jgi:hypothetical protein
MQRPGETRAFVVFPIYGRMRNERVFLSLM